MQVAMIFKPFSYSYQNVPTSINPISSSSLLISLSPSNTHLSYILQLEVESKKFHRKMYLYKRRIYGQRNTHRIEYAFYDSNSLFLYFFVCFFNHHSIFQFIFFWIPNISICDEYQPYL